MRRIRTGLGRWGMMGILALAASAAGGAAAQQAAAPSEPARPIAAGPVAAETVSNEFSILMDLARVYRGQDQFDRARKRYEQALGKAPSDRQESVAHLELAVIARAEGKANVAIVHTQRALRLTKDPAERCRIHPELISFMIETGKWLPAERAALKFLVEAPTESGRQQAKGFMIAIYKAQDRLGEMEAALERARAKNPSNAYVLELLGRVHEEMGAREKAVQSYRTLSRLRPRDPTVWARLAQACESTGKLDAAAQACWRIIELRGGDPAFNPDLVRARVAGMCARNKRPNVAARWIEAMGTDGRPSAQTALSKAELFSGLGMTAKAVNCLDEAVRTERNHESRSVLLLKAAALLEAAGSNDGAKDRLKAILNDAKTARATRLHVKAQLYRLRALPRPEIATRDE
ncbi:MAG: tetratricopeptide repeat protein [Candidatus Brocadiia bacterium]|nr:tetratricopeptide repeat protein [Candidatus Brocadiia bacterium]